MLATAIRDHLQALGCPARVTETNPPQVMVGPPEREEACFVARDETVDAFLIDVPGARLPSIATASWVAIAGRCAEVAAAYAADAAHGEVLRAAHAVASNLRTRGLSATAMDGRVLVDFAPEDAERLAPALLAALGK